MTAAPVTPATTGAPASAGTPAAAPADVPWLTASEQVAWRAYLRGQRLLEVALDRDLQQHGVSLTEYEVLSMLSEQEGRSLRMSELADLVVQSRSRLTHTATRLAGRGLVERRPAPGDGRGVLLTLTDAGMDLLHVLAPVHVASVRAHWLDALTPDLVCCLGEAMARVREGNGGTQSQRDESARVGR